MDLQNKNVGKILVGFLAIAISGCKVSAPSSINLDAGPGGGSGTVAPQAASVRAEVWRGTTLIYNESTNFGTFEVVNSSSLAAGYNIKISSPNPEVSLTFRINNGPQYPLVIGNNAFPPAGMALPNVGNHTFTIFASVPGAPTSSKSYSLAVSCDPTSLPAIVLNTNAITVSSPSQNVYAYNAANVASGGSGSFQCAWDFNGDGIRDSQFAACNQAKTEYSNHIKNRRLNVYVRDQVCNNTVTATKERTLVSQTPAQLLAARTVFIAGDVSSPSLPGDQRVHVSHLSTNPGSSMGVKVECKYSKNANGTSNFTISGFHHYLDESKKHGLSIAFEGMTDNVDMLTGGGTINTANATVSSARFRTDQAADLAAQLTYQGGPQCSGSITAVPLNVQGVPCAEGSADVNGSYTVEASGTFSCSNLPATSPGGGVVNIQNGAFYCATLIVDSCSGGQGQGQGGIFPIEF